MGYQGGHSRFLTGISMFVSIQPPDQHLPGHPLHRWDQILRPVSLPKWWDAVGCDPAPRQLGPHGLLQVGWDGLSALSRWQEVVQNGEDERMGLSNRVMFSHIPHPRTRLSPLADASDSHWCQVPLKDAISSWLTFRDPYSLPFSFLHKNLCNVIIPRALTSLISTHISWPLLTSQIASS